MNAMQYKISFPTDFDMSIVRKRVIDNGSKTDGFQDLLFKAYLIIDNKNQKEYSPLYFWNNEKGMNKFIFDGFFENIIASFGWQNINIAIPLIVELDENFKKSNFMIEIEHAIPESHSPSKPAFSLNGVNQTARAIVYNPDKWKYTEFYFFESLSSTIKDIGTTYEILHISL